MSLNLALAAPQYAKLRSASYSGEQLVSLFSNRVLLHGTIDDDLSAVTWWDEFNYTLISGTYTDCIADHVLVISQSNDLADAANNWYGRLFAAPSASVIQCNESSINFSPGAYFWVLDTFVPQQKLSKPSTDDPDTAVELIDSRVTYAGMLSSIVGLPLAVVGYADLITGKLRYAFDISQSFGTQSGTTITGYAYTFPGATVVAGATNTAIVIVDLDPGEQWALVAATCSNGQILYRHVGIKVHDDDNPIDSAFDGNQISGGLDQGWSFSINAFADVDSVLNNTLGFVWRAHESYGGVAGSLWGGGSATVTNKALTSNTVTLTADNTFEVGQQVVVAIGDSIFDGTFIILSASSTDFTYHKVHANVGSAGASGLAHVNERNVDFVGWLQRETDAVNSDPQYSVLSQSQFTFTSLATRMQRMGITKVAIRESAAPDEWGEITSLTPWRAMWHFLSRYSTVANLIDIQFEETTTAYQFPDFSTQGPNVLEVVKWLAKSYTAGVWFAPWGTCDIARRAAFESQFQRGSLTTAANFDKQDGSAVNRDFDPNPNYGIVDAVGAFLNPSTGVITVYTALAPGNAQGEGSNSDASLSDQILVATTSAAGALLELRLRAGAQLLILNNEETIDWEFLDGYCGVPFIPCEDVLYTLTLDTTLAGPNGVNRLVYTTATQWFVESVSLSAISPDGTRTNRVKLRRLIPVASPGDDTTRTDPGETVDQFPDLGFPAFDFDNLPELTIDDAGATTVAPSQLANPPGQIAKLNGEELLIWDAAAVAFLRNFITLTTPQSTDITPPSVIGTFKQGAVDPFNTTHLIPGYVLEGDGTDGLVSWNPNVAAPSAAAAWQDGVSLENIAGITGAFSVIRATKVNGGILVYAATADIAPIPPPSNCIADVDFNRYAATVAGTIVASPPSGCHVASVALSTLGAPNVGGGLQATVRYTFTTPVTINSVTGSYYGAAGGFAFIAEYFDNGGSSLHTTSFGSASSAVWVCGNDMLATSPIAGVKHIDVSIRAPLAPPADNLLSDLEVCYT